MYLTTASPAPDSTLQKENTLINGTGEVTDFIDYFLVEKTDI